VSLAPLELPARGNGWARRLAAAAANATARDWAGALAVTAAGGVLRFYRLATPRSLVSDEFYYVPDAYGILRHGAEVNHSPDAPALLLHGKTNILATGGEFVAHPPLGKIMIAAGEWLFGLTPFGWRFAAAIVGTLAILMTARIARRMTGSALLGWVAGLLLAVDGLEFVMSRTAMLDIFLMFWILAAFGCLAIDRDKWLARLARSPAEAQATEARMLPRGLRWWRLLAGVCVGLACATKWDALWYIPAFGCLAIAWDAVAMSRAGVSRPARAALLSAARWVPVSLGLAPAAAYLAAYSGWFASTVGFDRNWAALHGNHVPVWSALDSFYHDTSAMLQYGVGLMGAPQSPPWSWLTLTRPMTFYFAATSVCTHAGCSEEKVQQILAIGTPAIWWAAIPALLACAAWWLTTREWQAGAVVLCVLSGWLPWIWFAWHGNRIVYYFYALAFDPFLVIAITLCLGWLVRRSSRRWRTTGRILTVGYLLAVVADFAYMYPVLTAARLSEGAWLARMWLPGWRL
jgi:dolichyl-phosphate-mannose-protein mannosyltransferase